MLLLNQKRAFRTVKYRAVHERQFWMHKCVLDDGGVFAQPDKPTALNISGQCRRLYSRAFVRTKLDLTHFYMREISALRGRL